MRGHNLLLKTMHCEGTIPCIIAVGFVGKLKTKQKLYRDLGSGDITKQGSGIPLAILRLFFFFGGGGERFFPQYFSK